MTKRRAPDGGSEPESASRRDAPPPDAPPRDAGPRDATPHDHAYKQLFSHAEMVRQLLVGFVHEDWVAELDFATLEPVRSSFVTDDMRQREDDVIWKVRWGERSLYVYLLIEFQSSVDDFMALRVANYVTLLYQDLLRQAKPRSGAKLPPVLPLVLYSGAQGWTAALELGELIEPLPLGMARFRPRFSYLLVDERAVVAASGEQPAEVKDFVTALFRMEHAATEADWLQLFQRLKALLESAETSTLRASFRRWLYRSYIRHKPAHLELPDADDFMGVYAVLEERVKQWNEELIAKGREQGVRQGLEQGLEQGVRQVALAMLRDGKLDAATIARYSGLPLAAVLELQASLATH